MNNKTFFIILTITLLIGAAASFFITRSIYDKKEIEIIMAPFDDAAYIKREDSLKRVIDTYSDSIIIMENEIKTISDQKKKLLERVNAFNKSDIRDWLNKYSSAK